MGVQVQSAIDVVPRATTGCVANQSKPTMVGMSILTTGDATAGNIGAVGIWHPNNPPRVLMCRSPWGEHDSDIYDIYADETGTVAEGEGEVETFEYSCNLLDRLHEVVQETLVGANANIVTFGNTDSGGMEALRTRNIKEGRPWALHGTHWAGVYPVLKQNLTLTVDEEYGTTTATSLEAVHRLLFEQEREFDTPHGRYLGHRYDPLVPPVNIVDEFRRREYLKLALHATANAHRVWELGQIAQEYLPKYEFQFTEL